MKTLKAVAARYNATSLILRIVIGLAVGAVLALAVPGAGWVEEFGSLFVGALKGIAPVLVFVIVASALAQGTSRLDRRFGTVIWLYMLTTFLSMTLSSSEVSSPSTKIVPSVGKRRALICFANVDFPEPL